MTPADLTAFVATGGLALILPLSVIEGPIVSVVSGILCAQDLLDWRLVLPVLIVGDLVGDGLLYAAGRLSHGWVHRMALRLGLPVAQGERFAARLAAHDLRLLLIGKWTHAIGAVVLIAAGAARIGLARFLTINLLATVPKSALLLGLGVWAGGQWTQVVAHPGWAGLALLAAGAVAIAILLRRAGPGAAL